MLLPLPYQLNPADSTVSSMLGHPVQPSSPICLGDTAIVNVLASHERGAAWASPLLLALYQPASCMQRSSQAPC